MPPTTAPVTSHRTVNYRGRVPTTPRKTPQRTVAVDDELWADVHAISRARREKVPAILRAALVRYRLENLALLEAERAHDRHAS